ncbi:MAG: PINc/VapC family ATPase [Methanocalculaceae archaeon]|jgi:ATPase|nr:PINc/VapC family ATPase [Methanocalculaceae archaeon]
MILVPDTSVVIDGRVTALIEQGEYRDATIIIPEAVFTELESQANKGREVGFSGLVELQKLHKMKEEGLINLEYVGIRPKFEQVKLANGGEIDNMIQEVAITHNATFLTSNYVQSEVARAKGINVVFLRSEITDDFVPLSIDTLFDENTLAVYLKERVAPYARKGTIRESKLVTIRDTPTTECELLAIAKECFERAEHHPDGFVKVEMPGVTVSQIGSMRITTTRPPFSNRIEITIIRPIREISIDSYNYTAALKERLNIGNGGMLIVGTPGSGKSTLEQNIATYLSSENYIVKTIESPRNLIVPDKITQYASLEGNISETSEILTLLRPDYVIFDEMHRSEELAVFADLHLSGIQVVGGLHARSVSDALIRLANLVNLSLIPQIIATMVLIKDGDISELYGVSTSFRVPAAFEKIGDRHVKPIVQLTNIITGVVATEAFHYEGEVIVTSNDGIHLAEQELSKTSQLINAVPAEDIGTNSVSMIKSAADDDDAFQTTPSIHTMPTYEVTDDNPAWIILEKEIQKEICRFTDDDIIVRMINDTKAAVYIEDADVPAAIGKAGKNIAAVVSKVGIGIDVRPLSDLPDRDSSTPAVSTGTGAIGAFKIRSEKKQLALICPEYSNKIVDLFSGKEYLFTATVDARGEIHLARNSSIAMEMIRRYGAGEELKIRPVD